MQFILDNIAAGIISMAIFLILVVIQLRGQEASVDATWYYAAKKHTLTFVGTVERDFQSMQASEATGPSILSEDDTHIEFMTQDTTGGLVRVRYEWNSAPLPDSQAAFIVKRFVYGEADTLRMPSVAYFTVSFLDRQGSLLPAGGDFKNIHQVAVSLGVASSFGQNGFIRQSRWKAVFRPVKQTASVIH
jgi:hypothetical protein